MLLSHQPMCGCTFYFVCMCVVGTWSLQMAHVELVALRAQSPTPNLQVPDLLFLSTSALAQRLAHFPFVISYLDVDFLISTSFPPTLKSTVFASDVRCRRGQNSFFSHLLTPSSSAPPLTRPFHFLRLKHTRNWKPPPPNCPESVCERQFVFGFRVLITFSMSVLFWGESTPEQRRGFYSWLCHLFVVWIWKLLTVSDSCIPPL